MILISRRMSVISTLCSVIATQRIAQRCALITKPTIARAGLSSDARYAPTPQHDEF